MQKNINLTKLQSEELNHKLAIIRDEPDLQESYEMTSEDAQQLIDALPDTDGAFSFDAKFSNALTGECENLLDIAQANMDCAGDSEIGQIRGYMSSISGLIRKIENALENKQ